MGKEGKKKYIPIKKNFKVCFYHEKKSTDMNPYRRVISNQIKRDGKRVKKNRKRVERKE